MSAHFAKCSYLSQKYFRLSSESWTFVSFGSPSLSSSSLLTRLRSRGPQKYALQVSFHAVYRRKSCAEIPLPSKFIFKDSLAPTKDATFGQKFQWPPTFSKKSSRIDRSQLLLDGRFGSKFHLAQTFFCDASLILFRSLLSITVLYSLLRHDACSVICAGTLYFIVLTEFSRWFKRPFARSGVLWITTKYVKHNTLAFALSPHKRITSLAGAPVDQLAQ